MFSQTYNLILIRKPARSAIKSRCMFDLFHWLITAQNAYEDDTTNSSYHLSLLCIISLVVKNVDATCQRWMMSVGLWKDAIQILPFKCSESISRWLNHLTTLSNNKMTSFIANQPHVGIFFLRNFFFPFEEIAKQWKASTLIPSVNCFGKLYGGIFQERAMPQ